MSRKEHKKHVKDMLAQAIVHKTLDLERSRQAEIKKKLEEIAKIQLVRRVRVRFLFVVLSVCLSFCLSVCLFWSPPLSVTQPPVNIPLSVTQPPVNILYLFLGVFGICVFPLWKCTVLELVPHG